jgi:hypothetical protein
MHFNDTTAPLCIGEFHRWVETTFCFRNFYIHQKTGHQQHRSRSLLKDQMKVDSTNHKERSGEVFLEERNQTRAKNGKLKKNLDWTVVVKEVPIRLEDFYDQ